MKKRILSLLLVCVMLVSLMQMSVLATETEIPLVTVTKDGTSTDYYASQLSSYEGTSINTAFNEDGRLLDWLFATQLSDSDCTVVLNRDTAPDMNGFALLGGGSIGYLGVTTGDRHNIVLDLNGHTMDMTYTGNDLSGGHGISVYNANLTIQDSSTTQTGKIKSHYRFVVMSYSNSVIEVTGGSLLSDYNEDPLAGIGISKNGSGTEPVTVTLKGGTFSGEIPGPAANEIPEGYTAVDNGDGTFTVSMVKAKIGETGYATLQQAVDAAEDGNTIEIIGTLTEERVEIDNKIVFLKSLPSTVTVNAECEVSATNPANTGVLFGDLEKAVKYVSDHGNNGFTHPEETGWENNIFFFIKKDIKLTGNVALPPHGNTNSVLYYDVSHGCTQFNLDLNGYEISQTRGGVGGYWWASIDVYDGAELTIDDTSTDKTGKISGIASCIVIDNGGKVTLNGGTLSEIGDADYDGNGIVKVRGNSSFVMNGGKVDGSAATSLLRAAFEYTNAGATPSVVINGGAVTALPESLRSSNGNGYRSPDGFVWHSSNDGIEFAVKGGLFDFNPTTYVAPGYECVANDDADTKDDYPWKVQAIGIAKIGEKVYDNMQDAFDNCPENGTETTITLLRDVDFGKGFGFADGSNGRNVVLDLNGYTYTFVDAPVGSTGTVNQAMHLGGANKLTVKNGTLAVSKDSTTIKRLIQNYCDLTLDDVVLDTSNVNGEVFSSNYDNSFCRGTVTLKGDTEFKASKPGVNSFDIDGAYSGGGNVTLIIDQSFTGSIGGAVEFTPGHSSLEDQVNYFTARIGNKLYHTLEDAITAVQTDEIITMIADETNAKGISVASGKKFTVDFQNHTYTINKPGAGSTGTQTQGFQLLKNSTITFKNGTIECTEANKTAVNETVGGVTVKPIKMMINSYCDTLTLENMTIDGSNLAAASYNNVPGDAYTVSNNCGTLNIVNSTIIARTDDQGVEFAFDSYNNPSYTVNSTVNVTGSTINGKVEATGGAINFRTGTVVNGQVRVGENKTGGATGSVVTIENGATVNNPTCAIAVFGNNTLNVAGEVVGTVQTNGYAYNGGSVINVQNGADIKTGNYDIAIYMPNGTLNISGGTITGETAVYFKSTNLNITGGTLIGNGEDKAYNYNGSGADATGDALVIDSCNYPNGIDKVSVSGGTFISEKQGTVAVAAFTKEGATAVTNFITGGSFSSDPAKNGDADSNYLAEGYGSSKTAAGKYWVVGLKQETKEENTSATISIKVDTNDNVAPSSETDATEDAQIAAQIVNEVKENTAVTSFAATNAQNIPANNANLVEGLKAAVSADNSDATEAMKAVVATITSENGIASTMTSGENTVTADLSKTVTTEMTAIETKTTTDEETTRTVKKVTYDVKPVVTVKLTEGGNTKEYKVELSGHVEVPLTFRLHVPSNFTGDQVEVFHVEGDTEQSIGFYKVMEESGKKFVEVTSQDFSYYTLGEINEEQKAQCAVKNSSKYYTLDELQTAVNETIAANDTLVLLKNILDGEFNINVPAGKTLTIDLQGEAESAFTCNVMNTGAGNVILLNQPEDAVAVSVTDDKDTVYAADNTDIGVTFAINKDFYAADVEFTFDPDKVNMKTSDTEIPTGWEKVNGTTYRYHNTSGEVTEVGDEVSVTIGTFTFTAKAQHNDNTEIDLVTVTKSQVALSMDEVNTLDAINRAVSNDASVTVVKKQITLPDAKKVFYNGKPQTSTFADSGTDCKVGETQLTGGIVTAANVTKQDVGNYDVTFSIAEEKLDLYRWAGKDDNQVDNKQTFSITKNTNGNIWIHEPSVESSVYGVGVAVYPGQPTFGTAKVKYSADNGTTWTGDMPANVGSYIAKFSVAETDNYGPAEEKQIHFTIAQAGISYTKPVAATGLTYNEAAQSLLTSGIDVTAPEDATVTYTLNGEAKTLEELKATEPGTYTVGWTIDAGEGYATVSGSVLVTIMEAQFDTSLAPTGVNSQYTGSAQNLATAPTTDALNGATIQYRLANGEYSDDIPTATEVGSYTVYYKITKTGYTSKEYYVVGKITPANMPDYVIANAPAAKTDLTYNGTEQALVTAGTLKSPAPTGANLCILYQVGDNGEWTSDLPTAVGNASGETFTVKYKVVDMNGKYADSEAVTLTGGVTISPIEYHVVITDYIRSEGTEGTQYQMVYVFTNSNDVSFEYGTDESAKKMYDITALGYQLGSKTADSDTTYGLKTTALDCEFTTEVADMNKVYAVLVEDSAEKTNVTPVNRQINGIAGTVSQPVGKENVNGTDNIDVYDATAAQGTYNNEATTMTYMQNVLRADVTKDGKVDSADFAAIKAVYAPAAGN